MGARHQISPNQAISRRSEITTNARWNLVQDRANEALSELLLLFFFVFLLVVRLLRSLVGDSDSHLLSQAQETPKPSKTPLANSAKLAIPLAPKPSLRPAPILSINPLRIVPPIESSPLSPSLSSLSLSSLSSSNSAPSSPYAKHAERTEQEILEEQLAQVREEIAKKTAFLEQASRAPNPPSPTSPYVPPHQRQASKRLFENPSSNPSAGPPFVAFTSIVKGCFYCHNKREFGRHTHRNKCPWFKHHLEVGTCHLNDLGELCLGPKRRGAIPLPFWDSKISQGEQVKRRTDGTEWDEVVAKRAKNPVVFRH